MRNTIPLAERLRPTSLDGYIGQEHLIGPNAVLRRAIESGHIPSMIFWGPPGVGKTTLAYIIDGMCPLSMARRSTEFGPIRCS